MKHLSTLCSLFILFVCGVSVHAQTTVYYVSAANGDDANNGTAPATAYKTLQKAIASMKGNANPGVEIRIESGIYKPTDGTDNATDRDAIFSLFRDYFNNVGKSLKVYGGYNFTNGTRDVINNPTYLDGDIGNANDASDNSYHIIGIVNLQPTTDSLIIDGVTIRNANGNGSGSIALSPNAIVNRYQGGGVHMLDCQNGEKLQFVNCIFASNAADEGGAINLTVGRPVFKNCVFDGNSALRYGGAANISSGYPIAASSSTFINSIFYNNNASTYGSAVSINVLKGFNEICSLINCSLTGNTGVGVIRNSSGTINLYNTIVWNNSAGIDIGTFDNPVVTASNCDIQGGLTGTNMLSVNPSFADINNPRGADDIWKTNDDGLNITSCSPVKDKGDNTLIPTGIITDVKDSVRIENNTIDIGAYETTSIGAINTAYQDADQDGYGNAAITISYSCEIPAGYVANNTDCDDTKSTVHPNAPEICGNGIDDNCNGQIDENCGVTVSIQNASVIEGSGKKRSSMIFTISLNQPAIAKSSIQYFTSSGSATPGADYKEISGTISFSKGQTSKTISVSIEPDKLIEGNENFFVVLTNPVKLSVGNSIATGTIVDDDAVVGRMATSDDEPSSLIVPNLLRRSQVWKIPSLPAQNTVIVTDMNGRTIMKANNYKNGYSFSNAVNGIYVYQIQVKDNNGILKTYTGRIVITD